MNCNPLALRPNTRFGPSGMRPPSGGLGHVTNCTALAQACYDEYESSPAFTFSGATSQTIHVGRIRGDNLAFEACAIAVVGPTGTFDRGFLSTISTFNTTAATTTTTSAGMRTKPALAVLYAVLVLSLFSSLVTVGAMPTGQLTKCTGFKVFASSAPPMSMSNAVSDVIDCRNSTVPCTSSGINMSTSFPSFWTLRSDPQRISPFAFPVHTSLGNDYVQSVTGSLTANFTVRAGEMAVMIATPAMTHFEGRFIGCDDGQEKDGQVFAMWNEPLRFSVVQTFASPP